MTSTPFSYELDGGPFTFDLVLFHKHDRPPKKKEDFNAPRHLISEPVHLIPKVGQADQPFLLSDFYEPLSIWCSEKRMLELGRWRG